MTSPTIIDLLDVEITETHQRLEALLGARALLVPTNGHEPVEAKVTETKPAKPKEPKPAPSKGKRLPNDITDDELRAAYAEMPVGTVVNPWLTERFNLDPRGGWRVAARASQLGLGAGPPPTLTEPESNARKIYRRAIDHNHSDPVGQVADSLGIPREKAKRLIGLAA